MNRARRYGSRGMALGSLICVLVSGCQEAGVLTSSEWQSLEARMRAEGRLRPEREPADAPFTNASLIKDFREIMFFDEYVLRDGRFRTGRAQRVLSKMSSGPHVEVFGSSVSDEDKANIGDALARLGAATGLAIAEVDDDADIRLAILTVEERRLLKDMLNREGTLPPLAAELPGLGDAICVTIHAESAADPNRLLYLIIIPAEIGGILRRACIEEELGQTLGPAADFDGARPSVFNDDNEFALLTTHDLRMLKVLYDPRLRSGMTADEAMPIVARIVEELWPGG